MQVFRSSAARLFVVVSIVLATTLAPIVAQTPYEAFGLRVSDRQRFVGGLVVIRPIDLNGDGIMDLVAGAADNIGRYPYKNPSILLGEGYGGFEHVSWLTYPDLKNSWFQDPSPGVTDIEGGDFNGDGFVDLFFAVGSSAWNQPPGCYDRLFFGNGRGGFVDQQRDDLPRNSLATRDALSVDVDGDGDLDLLLAGFQSGATRLYLNDGKGRFQDVTATHMPNGMTTLDHGARWAVGDLNGDGHLDAVLARGLDNYAGADASDLILLGDGTGHFRYSPSPIPAQKTGGVALGDLDGDGDLDLVSANLTQTGIWINDGQARFTDGTQQRFPVDTARSSWVGLTDWDRDGDLDVILTGIWQLPSTRLFENDGRGFFRAMSPSVAVRPSSCWNPYFADLDGDGDEDVVLEGISYNWFPTTERYALAWVMWNAERQLHFPYYAPSAMGPIDELSMGQSYNYELHSAFRNRIVFSYAALDPVDLQLPPLGRWRLDPMRMFFLGAAPAGPSKPGILPLVLPQIPALTGRSLYMQALTFEPGWTWIEGFSNATRHRLK